MTYAGFTTVWQCKANCMTLDDFAGMMALCIVAVFAVGLAYAFKWWSETDRVRRSVFANLDDAWLHGHFGEGNHCEGMRTADLTQDMLMYAVDFDGNYYETDIAPYVREWLLQKGLPL